MVPLLSPARLLLEVRRIGTETSAAAFSHSCFPVHSAFSLHIMYVCWLKNYTFMSFGGRDVYYLTSLGLINLFLINAQNLR